jgi:hypothetical protein
MGQAIKPLRALVRGTRSGIPFVSAVALLCILGASTWRPRAENQPAPLQNPVRTLDSKEQLRVDPSDRGATYHWLEGQAVRVTTRFSDAVAITERVTGGDLKTILTDMVGNEVASLAVDRVELAADVIEFRSAGGHQIRAAGRPNLRPTLDWGNRQIYVLWKDSPTAGGAALEWRDDLIRARGTRAIDVDRAAMQIRTDWADGFSAVAERATGARRNMLTGAPVRGTVLVSRLTRHNVEVGSSRWYPEEQVFMWSFPGLTQGYMDSQRLAETGGWPFTPDFSWANVQGFAFHYLHTLVATQGFVASNERRGRTWKDSIAAFLMPTVLANEPGCDGLHWLDRTIFRPCCDAHDRCYEKYDCTWKSWWQWWSSWRCDMCNVGATFCFSSKWAPYQQSPF